jgi:hypothetical protein
MRLLRVAAAGAVLAAALAGRADDIEGKTGLKVGAKAPAFALKDQSGKERTLEEFLKGHDKVAIVFHRSAEW